MRSGRCESRLAASAQRMVTAPGASDSLGPNSCGRSARRDRLGGFEPCRPELMVSDPGIGRRALDVLQQEGADASLVSGVGTLLATPDAVAVHRGFDRLAAEYPTLREFRALLPRVDAARGGRVRRPR